MRDDRQPAQGETRFVESVDVTMVCWMRLVLAASALLIIYIAPSEPDRMVGVTYAALSLYTLYSGLLCLLSARRGGRLNFRAGHWVDTAWYVLLVALSSGTGSIFFLCFFFPVIVASFQWGFEEGLRVAVASAALFTVTGLLTTPAGQPIELNRFLLRPVYLLVLGYMVAYWGGYEIELKRRLALLKEVNTLSNPRFGVGHTVTSVMRRVRAFFDADVCVIVLRDSSAGGFRLTRVGRGGGDDDGARGEPLPAEVAAQFLALPETLAAVYNAAPPFWRPFAPRHYARDISTGAEAEGAGGACARLAVLLDADSFVSVPLAVAGQHAGRAFLAGRRGGFRRHHLSFLLQIVEHVTPALNNVRLLDRLASSAAEQERQKIARDIHDSVIQPYIGLQYKVAAIRNKLAAGGADVSADLEHLFDVTVGEVTGLRKYVRGLKEAGASRDDLLSAVRRYVEQFEDSYGIAVRVECETDISINDRLAAELIQMVHEGLSNVRKHTEATRAAVRFACRDGRVVLRVENEQNGGPPAAAFVPRSISERAEDLGGRARVENVAGSHTAVRVEIPL